MASHCTPNMRPGLREKEEQLKLRRLPFALRRQCAEALPPSS